MDKNKTYYGITIGPIVKTLCMTSTPGGLWLASYIFSYIAKDLVTQIKDNGGDILIPSFDEKDIFKEVGAYPDHIIFIAKDDLEVNDIINKTKDKVSCLLYKALEKKKDKDDIKEFVRKYINIHCIKTKNINNIMNDISEILDNVEQFNFYVYEEKENYFLTLFNGKKEDKDSNEKDAKNIYVKKFFDLLKDVKPQVLDRKKIKSVEDIAKVDDKKEYKISDYLAIVQADGDGMTGLFENMGNDTIKVEKFSKSCMEYTSNAAGLVKEYGGVTIYAGGDDLLFLAPIVSEKDNKNILDLCESISEKFNELNFEDTSISFGIAINYKKFPLYESFNQAREMLDKAKGLGYGSEKKKNSIAINLTKASGLSVFLNFGNETETLEKYKNFIKKYYSDYSKSKEIKDSTNSVIYLMDNYKDLFKLATDKGEKAIKNFFINMYSNPMQKNYQEFIKDITNLFIKAKSDKENKRFKSIIENDSNKDENTELSSMLRFAKFLVEKEGEKQ
ncbi:Cas10/Cmr2 second palm domain-containing protein [Thomasclavelia cocleata]|uniref:Cas10/Cmr2 second palm domain-containing protein n=1 Tax=Thomasclavelia cocleata TaxID=69824 RepID=UPI002431C6C6|nr:hypothetical protein [Thomasclavelia cocleata]